MKLKHITSYPLDLKVNLYNLQNELNVESIPLNKVEISIKNGDYRIITKKRFVYSLDNIKPILHPLSDLAVQIEFCNGLYNKGNKEVPLLELAAMAFPKMDKFKFILQVKEKYVDLGKGYSFHFDCKNKSFNCMRGWSGKKWDYDCYVPNQKALFEYLYSRHFDLDNLIENNLAININK